MKSESPTQRIQTAEWRAVAVVLSVVMSIASIVASPLSAAEPITDEPWREAVLSVTDPDVTARFLSLIHI